MEPLEQIDAVDPIDRVAPIDRVEQTQRFIPGTFLDGLLGVVLQVGVQRPQPRWL